LCGAKARVKGLSDLALSGRKFSGNAQYRKSRFVLVHGTFLLNFNLRLIERCLLMPSKQPDYREGRSHRNFTTNLNVDSRLVCAALREVWHAQDGMREPPLARIDSLVQERYGSAAWSEKF
jgi:lipoate-protein ligase A